MAPITLASRMLCITPLLHHIVQTLSAMSPAFCPLFLNPTLTSPEQHRDYWANNGGSPHPDIFFPGFESGWHAAIQKLSNGEGIPDAEQAARDAGKSEEEWEWTHGFKQGAAAAEQAGNQ